MLRVLQKRGKDISSVLSYPLWVWSSRVHRVYDPPTWEQPRFHPFTLHTHIYHSISRVNISMSDTRRPLYMPCSCASVAESFDMTPSVTFTHYVSSNDKAVRTGQGLLLLKAHYHDLVRKNSEFRSIGSRESELPWSRRQKCSGGGSDACEARDGRFDDSVEGVYAITVQGRTRYLCEPCASRLSERRNLRVSVVLSD